ncbi:DUF192 domain-containing protein [Calothrix sp. NIES-3974]|uniref:DUF192 domain-containing protein n=1 Tax=Calothrix sp. NIES-3974 TaxID=2005462 RepID=UPI000B5EF151|nr:DUF192 domain-containing protein [Calothrix sp. NIES-3974]BAZ05704.1 hypothetical protein NIES3974_23580 [Calothrix sp. NIES-3974]
MNRLPISPTLALILSWLLIGCGTPTPANPPLTSQPTVTPTPQGQILPISAIAILPRGIRIELEVARTPQEQAMGLMYRPALPDNRGMLFQFPSAQPVNFWMKNVPVPLDMIFLHQGKIKYIAPSVPPCQSDRCPTYGPNTPIDQVIELRSGRAAELQLKVGDRITIRHLPRK